ncbi:heterokaryon incompatibility protein-domain-containing protein [Ilyonectria sp. MPI-CAGE-AT-0026]|nr:heterokaryon incompatibility protein-domain-containing protein [Ilyonectria sp. MPI-CAGE-AT-0026]
MAVSLALNDSDPLCNICTEFAIDAPQADYQKSTETVPPVVLSQRWEELSAYRPFFRHHDTFDELVASAGTGCALCRILADDFGSRPCKFLATFEKRKSLWWYFGRWEPHVFNIVQHRPYDPVKECVFDANGIEVGKPDRFYRAIPRSSNSKDAFDTARYWLKNCVDSHTNCSRRTHNSLPTRVIYVGEPPLYQEVPRLYAQTAGQFDSYVALSHCWGGNIPCKLTEAVLQKYQQALPMSQLPQNFLDAISVTRQLGLRYIWIDALCIIQDSALDWQAEASKMASFYSQALVTVSALDSDKSTKGFLGDRQRGYAKISRDFSVCQEELMPVDILDRSALDTRGWCMQERLLSPALLHFSNEQLVWECQEGLIFEQNGMVRSRSTNRGDVADELTNSFIVLRRNYNTGTISPKFEAWYELVEEFSSRNLTVDADILPAIAGAALRFRTLTGRDQTSTGKITYVAGLWEEDLHRGLFWGARIKKRRDTRVLRSFDFHRLSKPTSPSSQTCFPSWSWASVRGTVQFYSKSPRIDPQRWRDFEILGVNVSRGRDDLMATEAQGELRIRAPLIQLWYEAPTTGDSGHSGTVNFEQGGDYYHHSSTRLAETEAVMDSNQLESRECWLLVSTGPPNIPFILLLDKVGDGRFRRIGYAVTYMWLKDQDFAHFKIVEFTLV